jgi:hypothetical protein
MTFKALVSQDDVYNLSVHCRPVICEMVKHHVEGQLKSHRRDLKGQVWLRSITLRHVLCFASYVFALLNVKFLL